MFKLYKILTALFISTLCFSACENKDSLSPSEKARLNAISALEDSVSKCKKEIDSCRQNISRLNDSINGMLPDFIVIDNKREVEPYTILRSVASEYPLQTTGIAARLAANESFELIAALKGNLFNRIKVLASGESYTSDVVKQDQALNHTFNQLTTVAFLGINGDSIGRFINSHECNDIELIFLNNNSRSASIKLSSGTVRAISETWELYNAGLQIKKLEHLIPLLSKKAATYALETDRLKGLNTDSIRKAKK